MKKYCISYITNSGMVVLNLIEEAKSACELIDSIRGSEGLRAILSCIEVKQ